MTTAPAAGAPLQAAMIGLFESMPDGFRFCLDDRLRVVSAGGRGLVPFGTTPAQMIGKVILSFLAPELAEDMAPHLLAALAGQAINLELQVPGDGRLHLGAAPARWDSGERVDGSTHGVEVFGVWLPAPAEEERGRRDQAEKLKLAVRAGKVGLWDWDLRTNKVHYSEEWKQQIGYADGEIKDDFGEWERHVHPEDLPQELARVQRYLAERLPVRAAGSPTEHRPEYQSEFRFRHKDGSYRHILTNAALEYDNAGEPLHMYGSHIDITQRVETEEALRESEVRYRTLFEENQIVMVVVDTESGAIVDANPAAAVYFGWERDGLFGKRLTDIVAMTGPEIVAEFERAQAERRNYVLLRHKQSNGTERELEVYVSYAKLSKRSLAYGIVYDVTQRRQLQEQVLRQERLAAVGQLAAGIAHDFNNIMSVISVYAEMMSESLSLTERERARMQTIMDQAQRAARLIRQILDFSRQSVLERQVLDLLPLLKEEEKLLRQTLPENIDVRLDGAPGEYLVKADPTRMQQLVMNLAVNARDAMPHGGQLRLGLALLELGAHDEAPIGGMVPGPWLRLQVSDTGTGISPDQMTHIFEPFFTTKAPGKGTGLGLAQAHGIVAQHGGFITLASEVGAGTTFTIYLPALATLDTGKKERSVAARSLPAPGHGERVLVVEDEATVRAAIVELLRIWNYQVAEAANGEEALALLVQEDEPPDVILSDVVMPRLGGVGLVKALRHVGADTPVILMSGHPMGEDPAELNELRIAAWVEKPPRPELLAQALAAALAG